MCWHVSAVPTVLFASVFNTIFAYAMGLCLQSRLLRPLLAARTVANSHMFFSA